MKITRREFTQKLGGLGIGGILAVAESDSLAESKVLSQTRSDERTTDTSMRLLGRTGLVLSSVGFGAQNTRDADLIRYALDQGMNHIETAWSYGWGLPGNSCECIGKAIAGKRESISLSVAFEADAPPGSKAWLPNQFEQVLRDLATDHIEVFLWHHPDNQTLVTAGEVVDLMLKWKAEGKIQWCGLTTHSEQADWLRIVSESALYQVVVVAFNYKSPESIALAMQAAARKGVGLIAMKTQSPNYFETQGAIGDAPDHQMALNWVLSKDYVTAAIPGMTTRDQVDLNLETMRSTEFPFVPVLHAERDMQGNLVLWWKDPRQEFILEWVSDLARGKWQILSNTPDYSEGRQRLCMPATRERQFFRLRKS